MEPIMKKDSIVFGLEIKGISDRIDEESKEKFYIVEGILSADSLDQGHDIVETKAIMDSVEAHGFPSFLHQHDMLKGMPLGKTIELKEIDGGLIFFRGEVLKGIQFNEDIIRKARHGEYGGLSIGYKALDVDFQGQVRIIKKLRLRDASLVIAPMNEDAILTSVKSIESMDTLKEIEADMREHGYSRKESEVLISQIKSVTLGDQEKQRLGDQDEKDKEELEKKAIQDAKEKEDADSMEVFSAFLESGLSITNKIKED